jgi:molybdenum cofactor cytidylyltransferase
MIGGILLAAGESRRMGFPKAILPYGNTTFLEHLVSVLTGQVDPLIVVSGAVELSAKARLIVNKDWQLGQLSSLQCGLRALPAEVDGAMVALVDHPCVDRALVAKLIAEFEAHHPPVLIPTFHGRRGHPMIFSRALFPELLAAPLDQGARVVVHRYQPLHLPVDDEGILHDLDDPETYRRVTGLEVPAPTLLAPMSRDR